MRRAIAILVLADLVGTALLLLGGGRHAANAHPFVRNGWREGY